MQKKLYCTFIYLLAIVGMCKCGYAYDNVDETAYFIGVGNTDEQPFDWFDARYSCWQNYGELVSVSTEAKMQQLRNYILSKGYGNGSTFGTSGHSYDSVYPFKWEALDETLSYTKWLPGEEPAANCNLSLQLIDSELYMIRSWGYDQFYICEYTTTWSRICAYFHQGGKDYVLFILVLSILYVAIHKSRTKDVAKGLRMDELKV